MSILNAAAPAGGGEIKSESFSISITQQAYINTITTNTIPSWYVLVGRDYNNAKAYYVVKSVIGINAATALAYISKYSSTTSSQGIEVTITPTITTSGKLRFTVSTSACYFFGNYTLYYID